MSAVVKVRPIRLTFKAQTPRKVIGEIRSKYRHFLVNVPAKNDEYIDWFKTDLHKELSKGMTPGTLLRDLREAQGHTQKELGEILGIPGNRISDYETGLRGISKEIAKKLSKVFNVNASRFI